MRANSEDYFFVVNEPRDFIGESQDEFFTAFGTNYAYTCFDQLMQKLKDTTTDQVGFWHNRATILQNSTDLTIVFRKSTLELVAFYVILYDEEISFFQVFDEGKGIARMILEKEGAKHDLKVEWSISNALPFWKKMGIPVAKVCSN